MPLHVSSTCTHHQEVKIALHSLWYHHTYTWPSCAQVERVLSQPVHKTAIYRCDDTRGCVTQFWPPDDEYMCLKHVEAWNKLIVKQNVSALSWLITDINILERTQIMCRRQTSLLMVFVTSLIFTYNFNLEIKLYVKPRPITKTCNPFHTWSV